MGPACSQPTDLGTKCIFQHPIKNQQQIISPSSSKVTQCKETELSVKFAELLSLAERIKSKEKYEGVFQGVRNCPLYYLAPLGCYYLGQWKDKLPDGFGVAVYKNNSYYEGRFSQGELQSQQALYVFNFERSEAPQSTTELSSSAIRNEADPKATYYLGAFKNSKFSGKGKMHHQGIIYTGDWVQGRRQGQGTEQAQSGTYTYKGPFANGFKYGPNGLYERIINQNRYLYEGSFYCGLFHGKGKLKIMGRLYFDGYFLRGRAHGKGELICKLGVLSCQFEMDRVKGEGQFAFSDKQKKPLKGRFIDQIVQNAQTNETVRKILFKQGDNSEAEVSQAIFIDFSTLIIEP